MTNPEITVLLVDDESLLRAGIRLMLGGASGIRVIGEAGNGEEALTAIREHNPDVVLMDIRMPTMNGIEALRSLDAASMPAVVMLTAFDTEDFIIDSLEAGAVGFVLKTTSPKALVATVKAAHAGQPLLSPSVLATLIERRHAASPMMENTATENRVGARKKETKTPFLAEVLTERELDVATLIAQGKSNQDIASELFIAMPTVKTHIRHVLEKLGVDNRVQIAIAVLEAQRDGQE